MPDRILTKEATLPAKPEKVWWAWTTQEGIQSFFSKNCKIEPKVGGAFEMYFMLENEPGTQGSEGCQYMAFEENKMVSFTWNAPPQFPSTRGQHTFVVLRMEEAGPDQTKLTLSQYGWGTSDEWTATFNYFNEAWPRVLSNLESSLRS